jgi:hypothetical protein
MAFEIQPPSLLNALQNQNNSIGTVGWTNNIGGQDFTSVVSLNGSPVPPGAQPYAVVKTKPTIIGLQSTIKKPELRTRIIVPQSYLTQYTQGGYNKILKNVKGGLPSAGSASNGGTTAGTCGPNDTTPPIAPLKGGIIFPYTPTISYDVKADYATVNPTHSNYTQYFYQHSSVGAISISGRFTVQNEQDAVVYVSTVHLLKALTKMRWGGDSGSGSPPPVCRLFSYGNFMLENVPVAISSFRIDLPNDVDYYTLGKNSNISNIYVDQISVPIASNIQITCNPMYSRQEMLNASVTGWLNNYTGVYL